MKPIILISGEDGFDHRSGSPHLLVSRNYPNAVSQAGGVPVLATDIRAAKEYVEIADGLLLTHGPVIHPARFGQVALSFDDIKGFSDTRDDLDFTLCRAFLEAGKPVMAIGRGAKVLNITLDKHFAGKRDALNYIGIGFSKNMFEKSVPEFSSFMNMCKGVSK